ncbi:MAG: hypothetical protein EKK48_08300 [Candidatus Melainabacteria bacterium]|nr:MAG: hypothetical protein EKK48_08300 [Candidatus Melainabacteria bacterium]
MTVYPHYELSRVQNEHEAAELEQLLKENPADLKSRLELTIHYLRDSNDRALPHVIWLIENEPEIDFKKYNVWVGAQFIEPVEAAWNKAIAKAPENLTILRNAISSCSLLSKGNDKKWLERGYKIDPSNEEWPNELSFKYYLDTLDKPLEEGKKSAFDSVKLGKEAIELYRRAPKEGYFQNCLGQTVDRLAEICFKYGWLDDAQYMGDYLIEHGAEQQKAGTAVKLRYGVSEVHLGHSILGRVSLRRNNLTETDSHMQAMPLMRDLEFRIDLQLAKDLLNHSHINLVCAYLDRCIEHFNDMIDHLVPDDPFYENIIRTYDLPIDGPDYIPRNLRVHIDRVQNWKDSINAGNDVQLPDNI